MFQVGTTNEAFRVGWIEKALQKIPPSLTILDAGAGECQFRKFCGHLKYVAQDFGKYHGDGTVGLQTQTWDNSRLDVVSDIAHMPMADRSVDAIMCTEVLEHIPDPQAALREFGRLVKPGGYLLVSVPIMGGLTLLLKESNRALLFRRKSDYSPMELLRATFGGNVERTTNRLGSHKGFSFQEMRHLLLKENFSLVREAMCPFAALPWWLNSQIFLLLKLA